MNKKQNKRDNLNQYLEKNVKPIFDRLIVELLSAQPTDVVIQFQDTVSKKIAWSINWLKEKGKNIHKQHTQSMIIQSKDDNLSYSDDDEEIEDIPKSQYSKMKKISRIAISAEVYGQFNKKENFKPRVIHKSSDQIQRILERLSTSFLFQALDDKEKSIVVDAMEEKSYEPGDWIIKQGEDGNELYVIDQGTLDCLKTFQKDQAPVKIKTYYPGDSFGELALLYNAPRAASVQAKIKSICFALDRATFNNIVKDAAMRKREKFDQILSKIDLLQSMDPYERIHLSDGVKEIKYKAGETVITEGEPGDKFYMISEGHLVAIQGGKEVYQYEPGEYFGELALLKNVPRQATVKALTNVQLIYLDQSCFKRLMGPLEDILKRNSDKYNKYMKI